MVMRPSTSPVGKTRARGGVAGRRKSEPAGCRRSLVPISRSPVTLQNNFPSRKKGFNNKDHTMVLSNICAEQPVDITVLPRDVLAIAFSQRILQGVGEKSVGRASKGGAHKGMTKVPVSAGMLFSWSPNLPAAEGGFFDGAPNLESSKQSQSNFHARTMNAWNPKWRPNTAPQSLVTKHGPQVPEKLITTGPSGEVAGMHESHLFATQQMQTTSTLLQQRAANNNRPSTSPVVGSPGLSGGGGRRVGLRTRQASREAGKQQQRQTGSSYLEKRLSDAGCQLVPGEHKARAKPGGQAALLASEALPLCYRKAMYVGDDLRQCYSFHPEVPRKQGEFVGEHKMESETPHGTINNLHGHVMPHGRSHQKPGGSHAYIQPSSCQRCDELQQDAAAAAGDSLSLARPKAAAKKGNGWTALCVAASEGDISQMLQLVQQGHDVNHETRYGDTALLVAANTNKVTSIRALFKCGADMFHETRFGETPLIKAATSGSHDAITALVHCGMKIDYETQHGNSALVRACASEQPESARLLIQLGASVNHETKCGITPLIAAASSGSVPMAKLLIQEAECDTNLETVFSSETACMKAAANNQLEVLAVISSLGGDLNHMNRHGETALSRAAKSGAVRTIGGLLDRGALPEFEDSTGLSPLGHATAASQIDAVKMMVKKNCDVNREMASCDTPLMLAARAADLEMIQVLIQLGANINAESSKHDTALCLSSVNSNAANAKQIIIFLCAQKADPNFSNAEHITPIMYASRAGAVPGIKQLALAGANVTCELPPGNTAIVLAASKGHSDAVRVLIELGANPNHETNDGMTPLIVASSAQSDSSVQELISKGAKAEYESKYGDTALMSAVATEDATAIMSLVKWGASVNHVTSRGVTPLIRAAMLDKPRSATVLRLAGANIMTETQEGSTAVQVACGKGFNRVLEALLMEDTERKQVNHESLEGWTGLMKAAEHNRADTIRMLGSKYGADVDRESKHGMTALMVAVDFGHADAVQALLERGADADLNVRGTSARAKAVSYNNRQVIQMILTVKPPPELDRRMEHAMAKVQQAKQRAEQSRIIQGFV